MVRVGISESESIRDIICEDIHKTQVRIKIIPRSRSICRPLLHDTPTSQSHHLPLVGLIGFRHVELGGIITHYHAVDKIQLLNNGFITRTRCVRVGR